MTLDPDDGWQLEQDNDSDGRWRQIRWRLPAAAIHAALFGPAEADPTRAGDQWEAQGALLLSDVTLLDDQLVATTLILHPEADPHQARLKVIVTTEQAWPAALQARLQINHHDFIAALTDGAASFSGLALEELLEGLSLALEHTPPVA